MYYYYDYNTITLPIVYNGRSTPQIRFKKRCSVASQISSVKNCHT